LLSSKPCGQGAGNGQRWKCQNHEVHLLFKKLDSNSSAAPRESCTNNQEEKTLWIIKMLIKMCTLKIAENASLQN